MAADSARVPRLAREELLLLHPQRLRRVRAVGISGSRGHDPHSRGRCDLRRIRVYGDVFLRVHESARSCTECAGFGARRGTLFDEQGPGHLPGLPLRPHHAGCNHSDSLPPQPRRPLPAPCCPPVPPPRDKSAARGHLHVHHLAHLRVASRRDCGYERHDRGRRVSDHAVDADRVPTGGLPAGRLAHPLPPLLPPPLPRPPPRRVRGVSDARYWGHIVPFQRNPSSGRQRPRRNNQRVTTDRCKRAHRQCKAGRGPAQCV
mmetsp:Transcript_46616/g.109665  ORF Transcript_46616/g.109665 Transcript_46616/m.109665 type:complete len:260 (+) Transcript_46616:627-1406(+)